MKQLFLLIVFAVTSLLLNAQPPAGPSKPGDYYGEKTTANGAISVKELDKKLKKNETVNVKVKGTVVEVCSKKGCWLTMEMPDKTKMTVKFKEYGFFVPVDLSGKTVVLNGEAKRKIVSVNELKHYAQDAKKPQPEIDAITKPEKQLSYTASGVLVI